MNSEQQRQQIGKKHEDKLFLALIAQEICQTSKQLCEETAMLQKKSQDIVRMSQLERQTRKKFIHTLTESTSTL
jgi:hypothetical protein